MKKNITVLHTEIKTSKNGGQYMFVEDTNGERYTCWIPILFDQIKDSIDVEIMEKNGFKNIVGVGDMMPEPKASKKYFPKEDKIAKFQENKISGIERAQDRKEDSMKIMGSIRDSVLIITAKMKWEQMTDEQIKNELRKWKQEINEMYY